jgi:MFS transporter, DHA2 family, multidrug resistance protein
MGNATGLFNMLRNIGGSIGIAMATTALIRRADLHQTNLAANRSPSSPNLQQHATALTRFLGYRLGPGVARPGSYGVLYGEMQRQSALLAYVDIFRWTAVLAFFCAGAVWLFKKPAKHHEPPMGAH